MGGLVEVDAGREGVLADGVELVAVLHSQLSKRREITVLPRISLFFIINRWFYYNDFISDETFDFAKCGQTFVLR